ncbi:MAG: hypothetical protein HQL90_13180 [Magnetococcales bacterium]|nr:hypothetical protein [Magnetococcales bacterium]
MSHPAPQSQPAPTKGDFWVWNLSARFLFWSSLLFLCTLAGILYSTLWGVPWTQFHGRVGQLAHRDVPATQLGRRPAPGDD